MASHRQHAPPVQNVARHRPVAPGIDVELRERVVASEGARLLDRPPEPIPLRREEDAVGRVLQETNLGAGERGTAIDVPDVVRGVGVNVADVDALHTEIQEGMEVLADFLSEADVAADAALVVGVALALEEEAAQREADVGVGEVRLAEVHAVALEFRAGLEHDLEQLAGAAERLAAP